MDYRCKVKDFFMRAKRLYFASIFFGIVFASSAKADDQCNALSSAAFKNDSEQVSALIASGVSVNCSYTGSYVEKSTGNTVTYTSTPLNLEANSGALETVRMLLSQGADVNLRDGVGYTPLFNANEAGADLYIGDGTDQKLKNAAAVYDLIIQAGGVM